MKQKNKSFRLLSLVLAFLLISAGTVLFASCRRDASDLKIGVLWEDDSSGESAAWAGYLKTMAKEYGFQIDFTTTNSSSSEVSAINTYASKGYHAILLFSDDDIVASVNAAAAKQMYVVCPSGHPTEAQERELKNLGYYLGSVAPGFDTEFAAGYDMARYFAGQLDQTKFTVFGGATSYGAQMHIHRLAGMLAYLCEDPTTSYDGVKDRASLAAKVAGNGVDPAKFRSERYTITGYMDGFAFDDAFSTKLTNSLEKGGTCILSVGAGDTVSKIAYGIVSSNSSIPSFLSGGVDAITKDYASCFDLGYAYDCGKYASCMAPALVLIMSAVNGNKILDDNGFAPHLELSYWIATGKDALNEMLASDNATDGYCYNRAVIDAYIDGTYAELVKLCSADYAGAVAIHDRCNPSAETD